MDNLTHSLVGALIGQAGLKRRTGLAMPALIIGANIPDIDAGCVVYGMQSLAMRRGLTHGPIAMVLLPLVLAGLLWAFDRWQDKRGKRPAGRLPLHFGWLYALSFIGCLTHPALDWLNVYGVRFLEPFSSRWFYGDTLFIIDVWLWLGLGFATWLSLRREKRGGEWRRPARIALAGALGYVGLNGVISASASEPAIYETETIASPVPFAFWEREVLVGREGEWFVQTDKAEFVEVVSRSDGKPAEPLVLRPSLRPISADRCRWPALDRVRLAKPQLDAFLFWSRAPFAERAPDGSVLLRDARFTDPRARGRFTVALPDVKCEPAE